MPHAQTQLDPPGFIDKFEIHAMNKTRRTRFIFHGTAVLAELGKIERFRCYTKTKRRHFHMLSRYFQQLMCMVVLVAAKMEMPPEEASGKWREQILKDKDERICLPAPVDQICDWNLALTVVLFCIMIGFVVVSPSSRAKDASTSKTEDISSTKDEVKEKKMCKKSATKQKKNEGKKEK